MEHTEIRCEGWRLTQQMNGLVINTVTWALSKWAQFVTETRTSNKRGTAHAQKPEVTGKV